MLWNLLGAEESLVLRTPDLQVSLMPQSLTQSMQDDSAYLLRMATTPVRKEGEVSNVESNQPDIRVNRRFSTTKSVSNFALSSVTIMYLT